MCMWKDEGIWSMDFPFFKQVKIDPTKLQYILDIKTIKLLFIYESSLTVLILGAAISLLRSSSQPHKYLLFLSKKFMSVVGPRCVHRWHLRVLWNGFDLENFRVSVSVTCAAKEYDLHQMCSFAQAGLLVGFPEVVSFSLYSQITKWIVLWDGVI